MGISPYPFIIGEMGITHDGSLDRAMSLVHSIGQLGAAAVKTQFWSSTEKLRARMHTEAVKLKVDLDEVRTRQEWLSILREEAKRYQMEFLCTVDLFEDIDVVAPYVDRFKIASWGATDRVFIDAHRRWDKPIIVSLGTLSSDELRQARFNVRRPRDWLLHCVSAYPTPLSEVNLRVVQSEFLDGFSDHTGRWITGAVAVAAGARVLEVHVRHDETSEDNPDYPHSLSITDFRTYCSLARSAALMLGDGIKRIMPSERFNVKHRYLP